jgi:hypothetical protein
MHIKGTVSGVFLLQVFFMNQFLPSPEYPIGTVSNVFENSRRYLQIKVHHRTGGKFATGVNDTGGAPLAANIFANFRKNSKWP